MSLAFRESLSAYLINNGDLGLIASFLGIVTEPIDAMVLQLATRDPHLSLGIHPKLLVSRPEGLPKQVEDLSNFDLDISLLASEAAFMLESYADNNFRRDPERMHHFMQLVESTYNVAQEYDHPH